MFFINFPQISAISFQVLGIRLIIQILRDFRRVDPIYAEPLSAHTDRGSARFCLMRSDKILLELGKLRFLLNKFV